MPTGGGLLSYFSREEQALALAVGRWNTVQLEEVEEDLHLRRRRLDPQPLGRVPPGLGRGALPEP